MARVIRRRTSIAAALGIIVLLIAPQTSRAEVIVEVDPPLLNIGSGHGTPCAHGCGLHPNPISATLFSVFLSGGEGHGPLSDPLILILGLPYFDGDPLPTAPALSSVIYYDEDAGAGSAVGFGYLGNGLNGGDGQLNNGDASAYTEALYGGQPPVANSFTNWSSFVPGVTAFYLFAYRINQSMESGDLLDVATGELPFGTYAIAFGCDGPAGDALDDGYCAGGFQQAYSTNLTQGGMVGAGGGLSGPDPSVLPTPEPGSLLLLGVGLLVAGRRWRKSIGRDITH